MMKRVDELGISPWPWRVREGHADVMSGACLVVSNAYDTLEDESNARLIASAPEMYEALRTAWSVIDEVLSADDMQANCHNGTVFKLSVAKKHMLDALAKASGEEVSND